MIVTSDMLTKEVILVLSRVQVSSVLVVQQQVKSHLGLTSSRMTLATPLLEHTSAVDEVNGVSLLGIFTEREIVRVLASGVDIVDIEGVAIGAVMSQSLITLPEHKSLFEQHLESPRQKSRGVSNESEPQDPLSVLNHDR